MNIGGKDFTPSELGAINLALRPVEKEKAKERQVEGRKRGGETAGRGREKVGGNLPPSNGDTGKSRDRVAAALGVGARTLDKATAVVEAAKQEPAKDAARAQEALTVTPTLPYDDGVGGEGPLAFTRWNHARRRVSDGSVQSILGEPR